VRVFLAWCVHGYTALGLVAAGGIAVSIIDGRPESYRFAFVLMFVATLIDATDGTLARAVRVREVLPGFDGRRLDDLIDFQTYTSLPLLLIWRAELVPIAWQAWLLVPLLASIYGFCQTNAKTDDGYFLGFPSYWNVVAFYLYILEPPAGVALGLILFLALLTFVPARYLYPTHRGPLNFWTNLLGVPWAALLIVLLIRLPAEKVDGRYADNTTRILCLVSLFYPAYYLLLSWAISLSWLRRRFRSEVPKPKGEPASLRGHYPEGSQTRHRA
jgi:phosphatidylcholine synthase